MQAYVEFKRIVKCIAFNVQGCHFSKKLNQHASLYIFPDNSKLVVSQRKRYAKAIDSDGSVMAIGTLFLA